MPSPRPRAEPLSPPIGALGSESTFVPQAGMVPPMQAEDPPKPRSAALQALAERGFIEQMSDAAAIDARLCGDVASFYIGYDPTARSLHAGSLVCIMAMRVMQRHGHRPVVLLGGGTARVGDPSGRSETRRMLDENALDQNISAIGRQFARFIDFDPAHPHPAMKVDNADWLLPLRYVDFLRDIGSHFTVNRMIATKTYRDRLDNEQPLSFLEFNYQLLQAYDFLHLYRELGCTLQMGGSDQWGNMVAGVELIRRMASVEARDGELAERLGPAQCLTFPLLTTADGRKMGKTERGAVWLDAELLPPFDYYQYWVSVDDRDVRKMLLMFTDLEVEEVDALCRAEGAALRDVKARLAYEATALAHGPEQAERAKVAAVQAFGGSDDWSAVPAVELASEEIGLLDLLIDERIKAFASKRQARQRVEDGAVKLDGEVVRDPALVVRRPDHSDATLRLQAGKKCRFRIVFSGSRG